MTTQRNRPGVGTEAIEVQQADGLRTNPNSTVDTAGIAVFQPMPDLTVDQYDALRADIAEHGVIVPIVVDQAGRILDGHNRAAIAAELGIGCPTETRVVTDDDDAADIAVTLNCARRHLNRDQVRHVIEHELARRPNDSDRAIARRVGCSPSTVGAVRNPKVSKLDTLDAEGAEEITERLQEVFWQLADGFYAAAQLLLSNNVAPAEIVRAILDGKRAFEDNGDIETMAPITRLLFDPILDYVLDPKSVEFWRPHWDHPTFKPFTEAEKLNLLSEFAGGERK